ncbi:MAG TPA: type VI secretion system lipoprotein TssJ [Rhodobacteraceae bacterium]|nr:type VI secretion system lipoprotein TssJ [Paracoccaceae bacterium]
MSIDRRNFIALGGSAVLLAGCMDAPAAVTISAAGVNGMNPGPDGSDRPLTLTVVQLKSSSAFDSADFFALQNPSAALGGDLLKADQIVLTPGSNASKVIGVEAGAAFIGVIAGFRTPAGKVFRAKVPAPAKGKTGVAITVGSGGISLASA